jgi:hypothetical protein
VRKPYLEEIGPNNLEYDDPNIIYSGKVNILSNVFCENNENITSPVRQEFTISTIQADMIKIRETRRTGGDNQKST